jgi:hypothetical protein
MFRRPMTRLAIAAVTAGTICALGAGAASAAPSATWSGPKGPVPGAITNDSAGISSIQFPVADGLGTIVGWRPRGNSGPVYYKYKVAGLNKGKWSKLGRVPGADTSSAPAFGYYQDALTKWAVLAVWTGAHNQHIWYSQGETLANGTIAWTKEATLPKNVADTNTSNAPSVLFTDHAYRVIVSWRGPANHVRYAIGNPEGRGFAWSDSRIVPGAPVTTGCSGAPCTGATPALAEVNTNATTGSIYFVWRQLGTKDVLYSTTADTVTNLTSPVFSAPTQVPGAATLDSPAASDTGLNGFGPLLLAYKAPYSGAVRYQTLTSGVWTAPGTVPGIRTTVAPALLLNELASTTSAADGNIYLHYFS